MGPTHTWTRRPKEGPVKHIVLTASSLELLQRTTTALQQQFAMKDLGPLHHFLGVSVEQRSDGLFLH
jgi:hypothetical protein